MKNQVDTIFHEEMEELIHGIEAFRFQELPRRAKEAIGGSPTSYREVFLIHRSTKRSYKEIAEIPGVSIKTIAYRMQQAIKPLREDLADSLITTLICVLTIVRQLLNQFLLSR